MTSIVKAVPEGYRAHSHRVPLGAAKNIAEKEKGSVLVNCGGGRYSVYVPKCGDEKLVAIPVSAATQARVERLYGGQ